MRNIFFLILLTGTISACAPDTGHTDTGLTFWDYLDTKPFWTGYGLLAGAALSWVWLRRKGNANQGTIRAKTKTPVARGPEQNEVRDIVLEKELLSLEQKLKVCQYESDRLKRLLAETEQFAMVAPLQSDKEKPLIQDEATGQSKRPDVETQGITTMYFLQPATNGCFKAMSEKETAAEALYMLRYRNDNPSEASVHFIDTPENTFLAIQNEPTWILVACERSNIPREHTRSIRTDVPGTAILKNGEWEILYKAKITYV